MPLLRRIGTHWFKIPMEPLLVITHWFFKTVLGPCLHDELVSDGFCDDEANTKSCDYDGGDCCGPNVLIDYCTICECIIEESGNSTGAFVVLP